MKPLEEYKDSELTEEKAEIENKLYWSMQQWWLDHQSDNNRIHRISEEIEKRKGG